MKISEYVQLLNAIKDEHGDLEVETNNFNIDRVPQRPPVVDYKAILKGRERNPRFVSRYYGSEREERKGEKVCRV